MKCMMSNSVWQQVKDLCHSRVLVCPAVLNKWCLFLVWLIWQPAGPFGTCLRFRVYTHSFTRCPCSSAEGSQTFSRWLGNKTVWCISTLGGQSQFSIFCFIVRCCFKPCVLIQGLQIHDLLVDSRFQYSSPSTRNLFSVVFLCHPRALVFFLSLVAPRSPSAFLFSLPLGVLSLSRLGISQPTSPLDPGDESGGRGWEGRGVTRQCSEVISVIQPIFKLPLPPPWLETE